MSSDGASSGRGLVIISGPSGVGKSSICKAVLARHPRATWSVSATTRPIRPGDVAGESYEFIDEAEFARRQAAGAFLETAAYCGYHYGTPRPAVERALAQGRIVILEIEIQGAVQVASKMPRSTRIFILPPTAESLRLRLEGRNSERAEQLAKRLEAADGEIAFARDSGVYQHFVVNDDLEESVRRVIDIIEAEFARS
ncbi:MAG: Guanylate kinase [Phycisphaerae bacterium]|nr:Guanylate kinase [Phycisphaerae bacterium]